MQPNTYGLTEAQLAFAQALAEGANWDELGERFSISRRTVSREAGLICTALGVERMVTAVAILAGTGLVKVEARP